MFETFHTIVFRASEGGGNPCPVTLHADELSTEQMQEMTHSSGEESVFLLRPTRPDCDVKARYFVPLHEMGMCLHATIGSAYILVEKGIIDRSPIVYETSFGPVRIEWKRGEDGKLDISVEQFLPKYLDKAPTREEVCKALRITEDELGEGPIESVATSRYKLIIPLKSRAVLDSLNPDFEYLWDLCDRYETTGFYPFAPEQNAQGKTELCARQFPNRAGYPEDPATGVAASALGAYLIKNGIFPAREGWNSFTVRQGEAMGSPSIIGSEIFVEHGEITRTRIRGRAVEE